MPKKLYRIRELAEERGITTQNRLMLVAQLGQSAAQRFWRGYGSVTTESLERVAKALDVEIGELFEKRKNGYGEEKTNNSNVIESGNKKPVLVTTFTQQQARVLENNPAFENSLPATQAQVPYRKAT